MVPIAIRIFALLLATAVARYHFLFLLLVRWETALVLGIAGILLLYIRWLIRHYRPHMQGKRLEYCALKHRRKCISPKLVDIGLTDIPKYPGGSWQWKHRNWVFYASRGNRPYMEDRMHYMNDPYHNLAIFSIFDGHGGPFVSQYLQEHFSEAIRRRLLRGETGHRPSLTGDPDELVTKVPILIQSSIKFEDKFKLPYS